MKTFKLPCGCLVDRANDHILASCPACEAEFNERHTAALANHAAARLADPVVLP